MSDFSKIIHGSRNFVLANIFVCISGCSDSICMNNISEDIVINDEIAILASQKSLQSIGIDTSNFYPVPYGNNPKMIYAHSANNTNNGYVLWHEKNRETKFEYSVSITRVGSKIYCDAGKTM